MAVELLQRNPNSIVESGANSSPVAIDVKNVTVAYRSYKERPTSLKESIIRLAKQGVLKHYSTFNALQDVSFQMPRGMVLGIIGSNGSGKSTLLKVLSRVLRPRRGSVTLQGTVGSLIELGVGFDQEMNAIENIYLNGSLHRRSSAVMKERLPHILEFAELDEFATTPIKYYSSGMLARLGFAVAIDIQPDILLVDEVLGVGDERFQQKCQGVFQGLFDSDKTVVLVSHDLKMLAEKTHRIILLSRGQIVYSGDPETAIAMYRDKSYETALGHAGEHAVENQS